jgi:hypothetical protein
MRFGLAVWIALTPCVASPQSLSFSVSQTSLDIPLHDTGVFTGTITNHTGVSLQATDLFFNFSGFDPAAIVVDQALGNPDFTLTDGATSPSVDLFRVRFGSGAAAGQFYPINVSLQDINDNVSDTLTVRVRPTVVPGPSAFWLFGMGMTGIALPLRRHRAGRGRRGSSLRAHSRPEDRKGDRQ